MPAYTRMEGFLGMSYLLSHYTVAPARLVEAFGTPGESDGCKTSGEYVFTDKAGKCFTLYDWKSTSLYEGCGPSPSDFWASEAPYEFHIGGNEGTDVLEAAEWLDNLGLR